jgi:GT2 family glycosyltransferase
MIAANGHANTANGTVLDMSHKQGTAMPDITISIVTANQEELILGCLRSIYEHTKGLTFETYVVINASSDHSQEAIREQFPDVELIVNKEKLAFTHNHNMVMRRGKGRYFLILNDDTIILDNALKRMTDFMDASEKVGILGCRILNADRSLQWSCGKTFDHKLAYFKAGILQLLDKSGFSMRILLSISKTVIGAIA